MKSNIVVPTLNAGVEWFKWISALKEQSVVASDVYVIDSNSNDDTQKLAAEAGYRVFSINKKEFNHGATRQYVVNQLKNCDVVIFLTQDAILSDDAIKNVLEPFGAADIAAVCGRQLPRKESSVIEAHARLFNYPDKSVIRNLSDKKHLGIKTAFLSNSFAAYRVSALNEVGGFPDNVIFGEDMYVAAKMLMSGKKIAYAANACVIHSHNYSLIQEFKRYFDMGVFHAKNPWIKNEFGSAEKEGAKFVRSEFLYLFKNAFWQIPEAFVRTVLKYIGFRLGLLEKYLPHKIKVMCSMNPNFFKDEK